MSTTDDDGVGLRPGAERPIETQVSLAAAAQLSEPCPHGKVQWRIDGELWHVKSLTRSHPFLVPCSAQLPLEAST